MTNREKAKKVLEETFGHEFEARIINTFKGCDFIKNTECNNYQDCEHCKLYHFWYNQYNGLGTAEDISKEKIIKEFKVRLRTIVEAESNRTNESGQYVYSINEEKVFGKLIELIWNTNIE